MIHFTKGKISSRCQEPWISNVSNVTQIFQGVIFISYFNIFFLNLGHVFIVIPFYLNK